MVLIVDPSGLLGGYQFTKLFRVVNRHTLPPRTEVSPSEVEILHDDGISSLVYRGPGWIGGQWREIECWRYLSEYRIWISHVGIFTITGESNPIIHMYPMDNADTRVIIEGVLGPALVLALALGDTWCLHASAALLSEHLIIFSGESGVGKSTLASFLGENGGIRASDDILPVKLLERGLIALPHFPQLKLPPDQQPSPKIPENINISRLYLINPQRPENHDVTIQRLSHRQAVLALTHHTAAARLFDKDLLTEHLNFCTQAARSIPVYELRYPHNRDLLPFVRDRIAAHLMS